MISCFKDNSIKTYKYKSVLNFFFAGLTHRLRYLFERKTKNLVNNYLFLIYKFKHTFVSAGLGKITWVQSIADVLNIID